MNRPNNQDWQQKLKELEIEIDTESVKPLQKLSESQQDRLNKVKNWFSDLPKGGKLIVGAIALIIGFSLLRITLQLISALITLAILAVVLYFVYQFFIASKPSK